MTQEEIVKMVGDNPSIKHIVEMATKIEADRDAWKARAEAAESRADRAGELISQFEIPEIKIGQLLYEADPDYAVCQVTRILCSYGYEYTYDSQLMSLWSVNVMVVDGHGKGSAYYFESKDFGNIVFYTPEEAKKRAIELGGNSGDKEEGKENESQS
jgi:hypothetical protein